jgi:hypothetical protein
VNPDAQVSQVALSPASASEGAKANVLCVTMAVSMKEADNDEANEVREPLERLDGSPANDMSGRSWFRSADEAAPT